MPPDQPGPGTPNETASFAEPCQLQNSARGSDNLSMRKDSLPEEENTAARNPFVPGAVVVLTLGNPRDKFWGMILALAAEGISMCGIELASFEDFVVMVKDGESFSPAVVFFPMHRVERIELDLPDGNLPSLSQRFSAKTGMEPAELFGTAESAARKIGSKSAIPESVERASSSRTSSVPTASTRMSGDAE